MTRREWCAIFGVSLITSCVIGLALMWFFGDVLFRGLPFARSALAFTMIGMLPIGAAFLLFAAITRRT